MRTLQPSFSHPLVNLRPLHHDDWASLYAVARDPLIWAVHPAHDRWQEPVFRRFFEDAFASGGALIATDPVTGYVIGTSRFDCTRAELGEIEVVWTFLARSHWGGAINPAMKSLMVRHALNHFDRVIFLVGENNVRSRRAMEKNRRPTHPARILLDLGRQSGAQRHLRHRPSLFCQRPLSRHLPRLELKISPKPPRTMSALA